MRDDQLRREWLLHRNELFLSLCLPSILRQSKLPNSWIILFDESDEWVVQALRLSKYDWIFPVLVKYGEDGKTQILETIKKNLEHSGDQYIRVCRLDNDDMLSFDYIEKVSDVPDSFAEKSVGDSKTYAVVASKGCRWDGKTNIIFDYLNSPFITYFFKKKKLTNSLFFSPFEKKHTLILEEPHFILKSEHPLWLQYIHNKNMRNEMAPKGKIYPSLSRHNLEQIFGLKSVQTKRNF
ncbi:glycosyltransferase [Aliiglaciecola sp. M165]|uniref:glycosyltransferase n=1 Tax=Aliiglaciecola sp. M165 TaxID=2593649 RepID=UPI00163D5E07|nr:glycosyltransferase [Aliiglaciecola sp. M165]